MPGCLQLYDTIHQATVHLTAATASGGRVGCPKHGVEHDALARLLCVRTVIALYRRGMLVLTSPDADCG